MSTRAAATGTSSRRPLVVRAGGVALLTAAGLLLPAAPAGAADPLLPVSWSSTPGQLVLTADVGQGALDLLLDDQPLVQLTHVSAVEVHVRYGNGGLPRLDKVLDGRGCTQWRASLDGAAGLTVSVAGARRAGVQDLRHEALRIRLCP